MSTNIYRLPFDESLGIVPEAAPFHYESRRLRYAVDFPMQEGTPIMAALDGIVLGISDGYGPGGNDISALPKCNFIIIKHINEEYSAYVHLQKCCNVKVGYEVKEGQIIGYSGISGFNSYPHLHFEIMKENWLSTPTKFRSLPARFKVGDEVKVLFSPRE